MSQHFSKKKLVVRTKIRIGQTVNPSRELLLGFNMDRRRLITLIKIHKYTIEWGVDRNGTYVRCAEHLFPQIFIIQLFFIRSVTPLFIILVIVISDDPLWTSWTITLHLLIWVVEVRIVLVVAVEVFIVGFLFADGLGLEFYFGEKGFWDG